MNRAEYDRYIARFNAEDDTAFDDYIAPTMQMLNGALEFTGIDGMKDHYRNKIWPHFVERLHILQFVSSENVLAVQMWTQFTAKVAGDTLFGKVEKGEKFDYRGLIMYELKDNKFTRIIVSYNSFSNTKVNGQRTELGIPH